MSIRALSWAVVFVAARACAQVPTAAPGGAWDELRPAPSEDFSQPEQIKFQEGLGGGILDELCRNVKPSLTAGVGDLGVLGTEITGRRFLRELPSGRQAVVDEADLDLGLGYTLATGLGRTGVEVGVAFRGRLEGKSMVVRPLESRRSCAQLARLADFSSFKLVAPLTARRIEDMMVGELWRLPFKLEIGAAPLLGIPIQTVDALITFGRREQGAASLTVYRLTQDQLRVRFRLTQAEVKDRSGQLLGRLSTIALASAAGYGIVVEWLVGELNHELARYAKIMAGLYSQKSSGEQTLLEFVVDPRDRAQTEALAKVLRGDIRELVPLAKQLALFNADDEDFLSWFEELREDNEKALGAAASFAGSNHFSREWERFLLRVPVLLEIDNRSTSTRDHIVDFDARDHSRVFTADRTEKSEGLDLPWVNHVAKSNSQRNIQVMTRRDAAGNSSGPAAVYLMQEGYRYGARARARAMVEDVDAIMRLAGTRGYGENVETALPRDFWPEEPDHRRDFQTPSPTFRSALMTFSLVFSPEAVAQIAQASTWAVMRCFANTLKSRDRALLVWGIENGRLEDDQLKFKRTRIPWALGGSEKAWELNFLASKALKLAKEVAKLRMMPTPEDQAQRLTKMISESKSGLEFDDVIKVLVQLVDPLHLMADFQYRVKTGDKAIEDIDARYSLRRMRTESALVQQVGALKARFAEPSSLVD